MIDAPHRGIVDVRGARVILSRFLLPIEREQAGIINAFGRTLAEDIISEKPVPEHDIATCGGYAVIASDTARATRESPKSLSVLSASTPNSKQLAPGTVMRVREGDPLPGGANAVVDPTHAYRPEHGPEVLVLGEVEPGQNVLQAGSTAPAGQLLLRQGTAIGAGAMEIIASVGKPGVPVRRRPRVAIITTGAGLVDIVEDMKPGQIRNAPRYALVGMLLDSGCDLGRLIHVRDGRVGLERAISDCSACDATIVAISSLDKHDSALEALANAGERHFDRVQIEPGGGCAFAMAYDRPVFVTEGCFAIEAFEAIIRPGLMMMLGRDSIDRSRIKATLGATLKLNPGYGHYLRAHTRIEGDACVAKPMPGGSSEVDSLIVVPENVEIIKRGESVEVILL